MKGFLKGKRKLLAALAIVMSVNVQAQDLHKVNANDTLKLTLKQAIEIAQNENPVIRIADCEIKRVDYSKKSAWHGLLPSLSGSAQITKFIVPAQMAMMGQVMDSPVDFTLPVGISFSLPLVVPALWRSIQMTDIEMQLAVEKARASKITLRNDVTKSYYAVLLAQDSYKALQDGYATAKENYEQAKRRYEAGLAAEYDYISAEVQMNNLQPMLLQVENGISQAKTYLKVLMGLDINTPIALDGNLADCEVTIAEQNGNAPISLQNNTDLIQLDIQQKQLQKALQLQFAQRLPTLVGIGSYGYDGTGNKETNMQFGQIPISVAGGTQWVSRGFVLGLQLNIPITAIFTNGAKEQQIKMQSKALTLQRDYVESTLMLQVRTALDNMNKAIKQVEVAKKGVRLSEKGYSISAKRYETGMGTMLELQNATSALTQSRLSYHQAISDYLTAKADYEKITGKEN
jgi:outer membrane protein TolC